MQEVAPPPHDRNPPGAFERAQRPVGGFPRGPRQRRQVVLGEGQGELDPARYRPAEAIREIPQAGLHSVLHVEPGQVPRERGGAASAGGHERRDRARIDGRQLTRA